MASSIAREHHFLLDAEKLAKKLGGSVQEYVELLFSGRDFPSIGAVRKRDWDRAHRPATDVGNRTYEVTR